MATQTAQGVIANPKRPPASGARRSGAFAATSWR